MKLFVTRSLTALGALMFASAVFHIVFIWIMFFVRQDLTILNPLYLYGFNTVFPEAAASPVVSIVGWGVLCALFAIVAFVFHRFRISIRFTAVQRRRKPAATETHLQQAPSPQTANAETA